jgi:hypothetical protein
MSIFPFFRKQNKTADNRPDRDETAKENLTNYD